MSSICNDKGKGPLHGSDAYYFDPEKMFQPRICNLYARLAPSIAPSLAQLRIPGNQGLLLVV